MFSSVRNLVGAALLITLTPTAVAQYVPLPDTPLRVDGEWTEGFDLPGLSSPVSEMVLYDGYIYTLAWGFSGINTNSASYLIKYSLDGKDRVLLAEFLGSALSLTVSDDGILYVAGDFSGVINIINHGYMVSYNIKTGEWSGVDDMSALWVNDIAVDPDGKVYVAGEFSNPSVNGLLVWDGVSWEEFGVFDNHIYTIEIADNGIYAGGEFAHVNNVSISSIAFFDFDSYQWSSLGGGIMENHIGMDSVYYIEWNEYDDTLVVGGWFGGAISENGSPVPSLNCVIWNHENSEWLSAGVEVSTNIVMPIGADHNGIMYASMAAPDGSSGLFGFVDGSWQWVGYEALPDYRHFMYPVKVVPVGDRLIVGFTGEFSMRNDFINHPLSFLYWYEPETDRWSMFGSSESNGVDGKVLALAPVGEHETYAGGEFRFAGTVPAGGVAHFKNGQWYPLGDGTDANVHALTLHEDGSLYAGGSFSTVTQASGEVVEAKAVVRWNPSTEVWTTLGGGLVNANGNSGRVRAIVAAPDGSVVVAGGFLGAVQASGEVLDVYGFARWKPDTNAWEALPTDHGLSQFIYDMEVDEFGTIYAGGYYVASTGLRTGRLVRLLPGGSTWEILRDWPHWPVFALALSGNPMGTGGVLYAGVGGMDTGLWQLAEGEWSPISGTGTIMSLELNGQPGNGGELYAGAYFEAVEGNLVSWDGSSWSLVGGGVYGNLSRGIDALEAVAHGDGTASVWVGGFFNRAGDYLSANIAQWNTEDRGVSNEDAPDSSEEQLSLSAYPNPAISQATISFSVPHSGDVAIHVYDVLGRRVMTLVDDFRAAGSYDLELNTRSLAGGTYILQLTSGDQRETVRFTSVR